MSISRSRSRDGTGSTRRSGPTRLRVTGSVYHTTESISNTLYTGSRAGSRYYYVLENVNTAELARDSAWEFMFVLGFPKWVGAVQAMINPIAIR